MSLDTVASAADSPDREQPYAELGLKPDEYQRIRDILGRRPTSSELAMYSVMWSEHCSYKSSKVHLKRFGELPQETRAGKMLAGIGENAGVVDIGQGWAVTFKVESHNHPSYVEPYQGAATGVGGIVRDIMAMGARPIAVMDSLRFGALHHPDTARVVHGVVAGVGGYGNCLGLPNIGGEVTFDECYQGNPLVNALCVGALRHEDLHLANATGTGNQVVLFGARTGGDGIGGVSVLASETFDETGPAKRPSVQVGDPFMEKVLIECCLDLFSARVVEGIQDLGGAGLSCATSELASAGDGGMQVWLDRVPLRDSSLSPEEILMSESQERMMAVVTPQHLGEFMAICSRWDVLATVVGEVTDTGRLVVTWNDEVVVDVPPRTVAHDGPVYERPMQRPGWLDARQADSPSGLARPGSGEEIVADWLAILGSANQSSRSWVTDQYDRYVLGNTAQAMPDDGGVIRVDESTGLGIALALDGNGRFGALDPKAGAALNLAEAYRNVAASGAVPVAVTDCLNFGSPEDPGVMWQFSQAVDGLLDACRALELPVTGGNVSLYNQTGAVAIHPTPVIGVLGIIDDVATRIRSGWDADVDSHVVALLGVTRDELAGSAWAQVRHQHLGGLPPTLDCTAESVLAELMARSARAGWLSSAHDLSEGGLAQALAEACLRFDVGATVDLAPVLDRDGVDLFTALFSESTSRMLISLPAHFVREFTTAAAELGVPYAELGRVGGSALQVAGLPALPVAQLRATWSGVLDAVFEG